MIKIYPLFLRRKITNRLKKIISLPGKNVKLEFSPGVRMNVEKEDTGHQSIIYNGFYELPLTKKIAELAKTGTTLVDVGANYGYFSLLWMSVKPTNEVYAFEPAPKNFKALNANIALNHFNDRAKCFELALSDVIGTLKFQLNDVDGQTGWGGLTNTANSSDISVEAITLDLFCEENGITVIDVLKIDTEGADPLVLQGADKMLSQKSIKHIFFEVNSRMKELGIDDYSFPIKYLKSKGYNVVKLGGGAHAY